MDGEKWTLILVRELRHSPEEVWQALTDPVHLREWAPFDADRSLGTVGTVKLTTVGTPAPQVEVTRVTRADAPKALEYNWWGKDIRELAAFGGGTRLTLWHSLDRRFGWPRLNSEYAQQFGIETPNWPPQAAQNS